MSIFHVETKDFNFVIDTQKNLNNSYIADMAKYASPQETTKTMAAFASIPAQLAKENHKFQYKVIKSGARQISFLPSAHKNSSKSKGYIFSISTLPTGNEKS